jgi:DNA-binding transcriptional LysR family regulator
LTSTYPPSTYPPMRYAFDPIQLSSIALFCKAAEVGSFTVAARQAGVTPAAVSRAISRIESRLGVRLFARSTRQVKLTDDGSAYYAQCREGLALIADAGRALGGARATPTGVLRVSVPTTYGHYRLLPWLPTFMARYPQITVEVNVSNRNIDFVDEGFDIAIRLGAPQDSRLVAIPLEEAALAVYAAPSYLAGRGIPRTLQELDSHVLAQFVLPSTGKPLPWLFQEAGRDVELILASPFRCSDDPLAAISFAIAGGGLCQTYRFIAAQAVARGELVEVLQPFAGRSRPFSLLYPQNRHLSAKVRAFVDFLRERVAPAGEISHTA